MNNLTTKRFVIRKSLIGEDVTITFTNKKFETMNCFQEYGSYTNSNTVPKFCRDLSEVEKPEITE